MNDDHTSQIQALLDEGKPFSAVRCCLDLQEKFREGPMREVCAKAVKELFARDRYIRDRASLLLNAEEHGFNLTDLYTLLDEEIIRDPNLFRVSTRDMSPISVILRCLHLRFEPEKATNFADWLEKNNACSEEQIRSIRKRVKQFESGAITQQDYAKRFVQMASAFAEVRFGWQKAWEIVRSILEQDCAAFKPEDPLVVTNFIIELRALSTAEDVVAEVVAFAKSRWPEKEWI